MNKSVGKNNSSKEQKYINKNEGKQDKSLKKNSLNQQKQQTPNNIEPHLIKQPNLFHSNNITIQNSSSHNKIVQKVKKRFKYSPSIQAQKSLSKIPARYLHNNHQHISNWTNLTNNTLKSGFTSNNNNSNKKKQVPPEFSSVVKIKETPYKCNKVQQKQKINGTQRLAQLQRITQAEFQQNYQFNQQQNSSWIAKLVNGIMDSDYQSSKNQNLQKLSQIQNRSDIYDLSSQEQDQNSLNCLQKNQFLPSNTSQNQTKQNYKQPQQKKNTGNNHKKNIQDQQIFIIQLKKNNLKDAGLRVPPATRASSIGDIINTGTNSSSSTKRGEKILNGNLQKLAKDLQNNFPNQKVLIEKSTNIQKGKQYNFKQNQTNRKNSVKQSTTPISQISSISPKPKIKNDKQSQYSIFSVFDKKLKRKSQTFQNLNSQKERKKICSLNTTKQKTDIKEKRSNGNVQMKQNNDQRVQSQIISPYILMKDQLIKRLDFDSLFDDDNENNLNLLDQNSKQQVYCKKARTQEYIKNTTQNFKKIGGIKRNIKNLQVAINSGRITKNCINKNLDNFIQTPQESLSSQKIFGVLPDISSIANLSRHNINFLNDGERQLNGVNTNFYKHQKLAHQQTQGFNYNKNFNVDESVSITATTMTTTNLSHRNQKTNKNRLNYQYVNYQNKNLMGKPYLNQLQDQLKNQRKREYNKNQKQNQNKTINNAAVKFDKYQKNTINKDQTQNGNTTRRLKYKYLNDEQQHKQIQDYNKLNRQKKAALLNKKINLNKIQKSRIKGLYLKMNKLYQSQRYNNFCQLQQNNQQQNKTKTNQFYLDLTLYLNKENLTTQNLTTEELIQVGPIISKIKYENYQYVYQIFQSQYMMINQECIQKGCYNELQYIEQQRNIKKSMNEKESNEVNRNTLSKLDQIQTNVIQLCKIPYLLKEQLQSQREYKIQSKRSQKTNSNSNYFNTTTNQNNANNANNHNNADNTNSANKLNPTRNQLNQIYQTFRQTCFQTLSRKKQLIEETNLQKTYNNGLIIERLNLKLNNYISNHQLEATYRQLNLNLNFQQLKKSININSFR